MLFMRDRRAQPELGGDRPEQILRFAIRLRRG